jgi:DNA-binding transcriptional ArsR family regulator
MAMPHSMFFKMLAARTRVQILRLLREHDDLTVDNLATQLGVTVPTVSRHLQLLRMHNLVSFNQDAQTRYYKVNTAEIATRIAAFLKDLNITLPADEAGSSESGSSSAPVSLGSRSVATRPGM